MVAQEDLMLGTAVAAIDGIHNIYYMAVPCRERQEPQVSGFGIQGSEFRGVRGLSFSLQRDQASPLCAIPPFANCSRGSPACIAGIHSSIRARGAICTFSSGDRKP